MKKIILIGVVLLSLVTISVSRIKEKGAVIDKFIDDDGKYHIIVKFMDGKTQDDIVTKKEYITNKKLDFYSTTRR